MKRALIIGSRGQDGRLLRGHLEHLGYAVTGVVRPTAPFGCRGQHVPVDMADAEAVRDLLGSVRPDELYYLAAIHHASESAPAQTDAELFTVSLQVHVLSLVNVLEAMKESSPGSKLFYAASSRVFGRPEREPQDERTPFAPAGVYGITKAAGVHACRYYRSRHNLFASSGILYNHESTLRKTAFVSRKIVQGARDISDGIRERLVLGDLDAEADWGYAPDFVDAFHRVLSLPAPDDFIIATGKKHRVRDFVSIAFEHLGLDWRCFVDEDRSLVPRSRASLVGNPRKLIKATGWERSVDFKTMVRLLVDGERAGRRSTVSK